ncbi:type II toxin-antitoxin system HicA family toxin [Stenoxybacter acetivorans]|uniref:type II toxin-antitoxin system HicA family toxin n=1 Tax=Stenoxybacter acetivorans TaxID=422441 RepID=UPI001FE220FF|nr:type II toxin-antitoxin system HicA family toxin [Stenoxybacter acetivorans]
MVKQSEFLRWLLAQGVEVKDASRHLKLYYNGKQTILPRHPSKELPKGLVEGVKKQLSLK